MQESLDVLYQVVSQVNQLLILPHNNPDPDAIASSAALFHLLTQKSPVQPNIVYDGIVGRAENRALVKYLKIPISSVSSPSGPVAIVDTQPGAGNINLPEQVQILVVIDHHTIQPSLVNIPFQDVRTHVGATSTIFVDYFKTAGLDIPKRLATALFYGIKTNTMGLSRNADAADAAAYYFLQPKIDVEKLATIEQARVPPQYFKSFDTALRNARLYNGLIISNLSQMNYPDLAAEIADLLLRLENARWVICTGIYNQTLIISVRTRSRRDNAEKLVLSLIGPSGVGGGHGTIAGGQISVAEQDQDRLVEQITQRALAALNIPADTPEVSLF